jgi:DNA repair exonuclease SbcCD ATPase subunit
MITEPSAAVVPPEISENIEKVHGDVEKLQRELAQALDVWQTTLASEKNQFDDLLKHKELAWREQEEQWAKQSQAYEERIEALKAEFESRLKQNEQQATQALAELDDAWQREKLEWQNPAPVLAPAPAGPSPSDVEALQNQLREFQETVSLLQDRASRSDELLNACLQALDYQISVLYDLVHHYAVQS